MKLKNGKRIIKLLYFSPVVFLFCFIPLILGGCKAFNTGSEITAPFEITGPYKSQTIDPDSSFEECIELSRGQVVDYAFKTSRPVDFNIHYHAKDKIHYPVLKKHISAWKDNFKTDQELYNNKDSEYFCLMWESNSTLQVDLIFKYDVRDN
jgi:hypothetical protein